MDAFSGINEFKGFIGVLALVLLFTLSPLFALFLGDSPAGDFFVSSATLAPFVILAIAAYLSMRRRTEFLKYPAYLILLGIILAIAALSFFFGAISVLPVDLIFPDNPADIDYQEMIDGGTLDAIIILFLGCAGAAVFSLVPLVKRVRVFLSSRLDFDPFCRVHIIALVTIFAITIIPLVPVTATGVPPYLSETFIGMISSDESFLEGAVAIDIYTLFWTILASFAIAGLFIKRNFKKTLMRLGLTRPSAGEILIAIGSALLLVAVFSGVDVLITYIWNSMGWQVTDSDAFEMFLIPYLTPAGIVIASVCAGFGEEISVRGVLQPRFGIVLPAMLFASLHAFQYNWDGIISVFIAGLVFGLIRGRYSTTVSAITHSVYDFVLFLGLLLGFNVI